MKSISRRFSQQLANAGDTLLLVVGLTLIIPVGTDILIRNSTPAGLMANAVVCCGAMLLGAAIAMFFVHKALMQAKSELPLSNFRVRIFDDQDFVKDEWVLKAKDMAEAGRLAEQDKRIDENTDYRITGPE